MYNLMGRQELYATFIDKLIFAMPVTNLKINTIIFSDKRFI